MFKFKHKNIVFSLMLFFIHWNYTQMVLYAGLSLIFFEELMCLNIFENT